MIVRKQNPGFVRETLTGIRRRKKWFTKNLNYDRVSNISKTLYAFSSKKSHLNCLPVALKVDISPLCNLRCPYCVHGTHDAKKSFNKTQRMTVDNFTQLIEEVKGKTSALSLYYLGDPLTHPDLNTFCSIASDAGIFTHISTNFSFGLTKEKLRNLVISGLDHITVCLDGYTQETYETSRVGGRIKLVKNNLTEICRLKKETNSDITIEVQYITNDVNRHELDESLEFCRKIGVDEFATYETADYTMESIHPDNYNVVRHHDNYIVPRCYWPYFFMTIKWNGEVIPCCSHRQDEQYHPDRKVPENFGNVFETSVTAVWNSSYYVEARKYVSNPNSTSEKDAESNFCHGCTKLCEVELKNQSPIPVVVA